MTSKRFRQSGLRRYPVVGTSSVLLASGIVVGAVLGLTTARGPGAGAAATDSSWAPAADLDSCAPLPGCAVRYNHVAVPLDDGRVLVAGGDPVSVRTSFELFNPAQSTWASGGALLHESLDWGSGRLSDGSVLLRGGVSHQSPETDARYVNGSWVDAPAPVQLHGGANTLTLLNDGSALLVGGDTGLGTRNVDRFVDGRWEPTGSLNHIRYYHTATLLENGKVLVTGGLGFNFDQTFSATTELYDPAKGTWDLGESMGQLHLLGAAVRLLDGTVLVVGGSGSTGTSASAELFDPATGRWQPTGSMSVARREFTATLLPNGKVLAVGGAGAPGDPAPISSELYDPAAKQWSPVPGQLQVGSAGHTATLLEGTAAACGRNCGKVLVAGEFGSAAAQLYTPPPEIAKVDPVQVPAAGGSLTIVGTGLAGATTVTIGTTAIPCPGPNCQIDPNTPDTTLHVNSPAGPTGSDDATMDVSVSTEAGGTSASCNACRVTSLAPPAIDAVAPNLGPATGATSVILNGKHLTSATSIRFGDISAAPLASSADAAVTVASPPHDPGSVMLSVTTPSRGSSSPAGSFVYHPALTGVFPPSDTTAGGAAVTVAGKGFTRATEVRFGNTDASFTVRSDTEISATAPAHAVAEGVTVTVVAPADLASIAVPNGADAFTYGAAAPPNGSGPKPGPSGASGTTGSSSSANPPPVPPAASAGTAPGPAAAPVPGSSAGTASAPAPVPVGAPGSTPVGFAAPTPAPGVASAPGFSPSPAGPAGYVGSAQGSSFPVPAGGADDIAGLEGATHYAMVARRRDGPIPVDMMAAGAAVLMLSCACVMIGRTARRTARRTASLGKARSAY